MTNAPSVDTNWIIPTQRHWAGWEKDHWFVFWCPSFMLRDNDGSKGETEVTISQQSHCAINQHFGFPFVCVKEGERERERENSGVTRPGEGALFPSWLDQCSPVNFSDSLRVVNIEESAPRSEEPLAYSTYYCNTTTYTETHCSKQSMHNKQHSANAAPSHASCPLHDSAVVLNLIIRVLPGLKYFSSLQKSWRTASNYMKVWKSWLSKWLC